MYWVEEKFKFINVCLIAVLLINSYAGASNTVDSTIIKTIHEKFNPGEFIFDHIGDAHEWPITSIGHTALAIPLPIIIYSKQKGIVSFWSNRFNHGQTEYKGFKLETEGKNRSKIVEVCADGTEVLPFDISITKNVAALLFSAFLILVIFISLGNTYKKRGLKAPHGLQSLLEPIILFIRDDVARPSIGKKNYEKFMPFLLTVFFFILINNM
jgi:F-type H+-transporting ATPase subunit a